MLSYGLYHGKFQVYNRWVDFMEELNLLVFGNVALKSIAVWLQRCTARNLSTSPTPYPYSNHQCQAWRNINQRSYSQIVRGSPPPLGWTCTRGVTINTVKVTDKSPLLINRCRVTPSLQPLSQWGGLITPLQQTGLNNRETWDILMRGSDKSLVCDGVFYLT